MSIPPFVIPVQPLRVTEPGKAFASMTLAPEHGRLLDQPKEKLLYEGNPTPPPQDPCLLKFVEAMAPEKLQPWQESVMEALSAPEILAKQREAKRLLQQPLAAMRRVQFLATQRWLEKLRPKASHKVRKALQHRVRIFPFAPAKWVRQPSKAQRATQRRLRFEQNRWKRRYDAECRTFDRTVNKHQGVMKNWPPGSGLPTWMLRRAQKLIAQRILRGV